MNLPKFERYGNYSSSNYGAHTLVFSDTEGQDFYFSYKTLVAFRNRHGKLFVRENVWGPTTGKHLNWIDYGDKKSRLSSEEFEKVLAEYCDTEVLA